ncbi:MAG: hypothetical protein BWY37_00225 [Firmicutes bacterium ADurb.Bin262]|nr:MAG: hypothetical protein BWY37_00225 [Firmicutes bacterium ADurb.Bin262]
MVAKPLDIISNFIFDVFKKIRHKEGIGLTGESEILPNQNTFTVAGFIESVAFVISPAPHPEHTHIGKQRGVQGIFQPAVVKTRDKRVARYPVGPLDKKRIPVKQKTEIDAVFVPAAVKFQCAKADFFNRPVKQLTAGVQFDADLIKRLLFFPRQFRCLPEQRTRYLHTGLKYCARVPR